MGGPLLFLASLLPLLFANRWAYSLGALSAGVGVGLFMDEVGKFITQTNDYFFPAVAPVIYAFFLLTVLLYLQVRRPRPRSARAELYHAFDALGEVLDHDLNPQERAKLDARLRRVISEAHHPDFARLARALREFLFTDALYLAPESPGFWERCLQRVRAYEARWDTPRRLKAAVVVGLGALGLLTLVNLVLLTLGALYLGGGPLTGFYWGNVEAQLESVPLDLVVWKLVRLALGGLVGLLLVVASIFMVIGQERRGFVLAYFGLLVSLTTIDLLDFYLDQFSATVGAAVDFVLLMGLILYRRRHVVSEHAAGDRSLSDGHG